MRAPLQSRFPQTCPCEHWVGCTLQIWARWWICTVNKMIYIKQKLQSPAEVNSNKIEVRRCVWVKAVFSLQYILTTHSLTPKIPLNSYQKWSSLNFLWTCHFITRFVTLSPSQFALLRSFLPHKANCQCKTYGTLLQDTDWHMLLPICIFCPVIVYRP